MEVKNGLKSRFRRVMRTVGLAGILAGVSFGLVGCESQAEIEKEKRKLASLAKYVAPPCYQERTYDLGNGHYVDTSVTRGDGFFDSCWLTITVDSNMKFSSNNSGIYEYTTLKSVGLLDGGRWEYFSADEMWQKRYEDLLIQLYNVKSSFEGKWGENYDKNIKGAGK